MKHNNIGHTPPKPKHTRKLVNDRVDASTEGLGKAWGEEKKTKEGKQVHTPASQHEDGPKAMTM